jgi:cell wall-associated NlpC family hydrolase
MFKYKSPLAIALLLTLSVTLIAPAPVYASALDNLLAQTTNTASTSKSGSSSGTGIFDILIGLLLGKFLGNTSSKSNDSASNVLGFSSGQSSKTNNASGNALIETGKKYMGVPYVWGGTTPDGFDCSGFTQYVMKQNGITIPRTAAEQFAAGTAVDKKNLQVGDLVFFTTYKPGASHVGFYMGNGQFLHASSAAQQVTTSSLDDQYYVDHYIGARRY